MDSSSDRGGARRRAPAAKAPLAATPEVGDDDRDDAASADPWFAPGPKHAAAAAGGDESADWFLRTGRAGLQPDSDSWQDGTPASHDRTAQGEAAGSPPWGTEPTGADGVPPPWETGPWTGPGDPQLTNHRPHVRRSDPALIPLLAASPRRRLVQRVLAAGVGVVVLIVIIVVIVTGTGGPGCGTYPAVVRNAYARAMTDMRDHAPASVQATALAEAASRANSSAAAAGQIGVRTAMFAMASDLDQADTDVTANRPLPATLLQHLAADGTVPKTCSG